LGDRYSQASILNQPGVVNQKKGNLPKASDFFVRRLELEENQ
jgi:hypothetical protein